MAKRARNHRWITLTTGMILVAVLVPFLITNKATSNQKREEEVADSVMPDKRVFMLFDANGPTGTGFRICRPDVVLTATHVIERNPAEARVVSTYFSPLKIMRPTRIEKHPEADVAALFLKEEDAAELECFDVGVPSDSHRGYSDYPLGEEVLAYGFPALEKPIRSRLMRGHIQSKLKHKGYHAYELAFPAFPGLSGSPVFQDWRRNSVIAVVTTSITYTSEDRKRTRADWAIGAALPPLKDWLASLGDTDGT